MQPTPTGKIRILVVDDRSSICERMQSLLGNEFEVISAGNVSDAFLLIRRQTPDVLVTNLSVDERGRRHLLLDVAAHVHEAVRAEVERALDRINSSTPTARPAIGLLRVAR